MEKKMNEAQKIKIKNVKKGKSKNLPAINGFIYKISDIENCI
jgi:hypothetical protein